MKKIKFNCPSCGGESLVEVMENVIMESVVQGLDEEHECLDYESSDTDLGEIRCYMCNNCEDVITDDNGEPINTYDKLSDWLRQNNMVQE